MSKVAFIHLAQNCGYKLIDCQVYNDHLASLGAREIAVANAWLGSRDGLKFSYFVTV